MEGSPDTSGSKSKNPCSGFGQINHEMDLAFFSTDTYKPQWFQCLFSIFSLFSFLIKSMVFGHLLRQPKKIFIPVLNEENLLAKCSLLFSTIFNVFFKCTAQFLTNFMFQLLNKNLVRDQWYHCLFSIFSLF